MASIDWTASGRKGWYEIYRIDAAKGVGGSASRMEGITGGQLTWSLNSDTKVSGSLEVTKTGMLHNSYVRVYYCAKVGGKTQKVRLCTCYASTESGHYEPMGNTYSGTVNLHGVLLRHTADKLPKNYAIGAGSSALAHFKKVFKWLGGAYKIQNVKDKKFAKAKVIECGKSPMVLLQYIADYLGAEITCDSYGRTVLRPYVAPAKKAKSYTVPQGSKSLVLPGIDITSTQDGTVNRAVVKHTYRNGTTDVTIIGSASASASSAISKQRAGRIVTEVYDVNSMSPRTQARANQLAKTKLKQASGYTTSLTFRSMFMPYEIGQVIEFQQGSIHCLGIVTNIDMQLDAAGTMTTTIRRVRSL